jgi:nucleoredoxin
MGCGACSKSQKSEVPTPAAPQATNVTSPPKEFSGQASLVELLGPSLLSKAGKVPTEAAIAGKGAVAIYFSAHWCPPCRNFTPQLAQWYSTDLKAKGLEIVFVSADEDDASFDSYFKDMPWLAVPFADRGREQPLSQRFQIQGIPSLVILDQDGKVITDDGRSAVTNDPTGKNFPWRPASMNELMKRATLLNKEGKHLDATALQGKTFALYFSAHWCPPCRGFTPQLAKWYVSDLKAKGLEVVFVSSDRDEAAFKEYYKDMPWLALNFSDRELKNELSAVCGVRGIPSLVIIGPDGDIINKNGRSAVSSDPKGNNFPWRS